MEVGVVEVEAGVVEVSRYSRDSYSSCTQIPHRIIIQLTERW
jgi:hypothetical protein